MLVTRAGSDEVLLARRAEQLRFFGGYDAFPGGGLEPSDEASPGDEDAQSRRAALREVFEEADLLAPALEEQWGRPEREALRKGLLEDSRDAKRTFARALDACPGSWEGLRDLGWLTTPPFAPVRYRTRFLALEVGATSQPRPCGGEIVATEFVSPTRALEDWGQGDRFIVPPVVWKLGHLAREGLSAFLDLQADRCAQHEQGRLHRIRTSPGVWMAALRTPTIPPATTTNTYVIGDRELWVLDPATPDLEEQARLFELLDSLESEGRRLAGVLVSHHHHDHVGAVRAVEERYGIPVAAHPRTLERLPHPPHRSLVLEDGARLELGQAPDGSSDWHLLALHTPGHDQGHLVFEDSRYGSLFLGDLASTVSTIVIDPPEGHLATYIESLERVHARARGLGHVSHGPVARVARDLLSHFLDHRARREQRLVEALGDAERSVSALLEVVYDDVDEKVLPLARRSLLAGLEKLREEGRAELRGEGWACPARR